MKKILLLIAILPMLFIISCGSQSFEVISAREAKDMLDNDSSIVLIDVREQDEYLDEHIPNAVLLPLGELESRLVGKYPDKSTTFIIYCRSGNRSNEAAEIFVELGYTNVYDMGGIIDWPYTTIKS